MNSLRRTTAGCLLIAFCAVVLLTGCGRNPAASGSPDSTGSRFTDVQGVWQVPATTAWKYVWKQSYRNQIISCLGIVKGNILYQGGQGLLELDVKTGKKLLDISWTKQDPAYLTSAPILWQNKLYGILSEEKSTEIVGVGMLYERLACLDTAMGRILWQSDEIGTGERPCGNPLLLNGRLYCGACFPIPESGKALTTDVHAAVGIWDAATGKLTGKIKLPEGTFPDSANLASDGVSVYGGVASCPLAGHVHSFLFCYNPETARMTWFLYYPTISGDFINVDAALAIDGKTLVTVFSTEDNSNHGLGIRRHTAAAFDTATGHMLWSRTGEVPSESSSEQDPEIAMRSGIAFLTINDGTLIAMDERTGTQKWSLTIEKSPSPTPSKEGPPIYWYDRLIPMVTRDVLYIREGDSNLYAVDSETGTKLWQKTLLTKKEIWNESKELCDIIPVDSGIIIVTANSADLNPVIELWK